jgi:hypothetical protein
MPWPMWADYRRFADFRLGIRNEDDGEDADFG